MFNTARKLGALLVILRGINNRLKRIEKKAKEYYGKNGNLSKKLDRVTAKLDKLAKKGR